MPRLPVDGKKVIEHRITFGVKERQILEGALGAYQFNKVATPIVSAISDVSFWITLSGLLSFFGIIITPPYDDDVHSWTEAIQLGVTQFRAAREEGGLGGGFDQLSVLWQFLTPLGVVYTSGQVDA